MKKLFLATLISTALFSCGSQTDSKHEDGINDDTVNSTTPPPTTTDSTVGTMMGDTTVLPDTVQQQ